VRDEAALQAVLELAQRWTREQQIDQTTVRVGSEVYRVAPNVAAGARALS